LQQLAAAPNNNRKAIPDLPLNFYNRTNMSVMMVLWDTQNTFIEKMRECTCTLGNQSTFERGSDTDEREFVFKWSWEIVPSCKSKTSRIAH
jgi:hypothetical protein